MEKAELGLKRKALENLWTQGFWGRRLLQEHTQLIDQYIVDCFRSREGVFDGMALVALGGYGRQELFPFSDIDLMLLYEPGTESRLDEAAAAVFYPLWDAGLEVGHAVRSPEGCLEDAGKDFFFQVAMLDARLLIGEQTLFSALTDEFRRIYVDGRRHEFLENMLHHREKRYQTFGHKNYLLEPHVKESRGGLRDVQAMLWTAGAVFGLRGLPEMENGGVLTPSERRRFEEAWNMLIKIRNKLHYISGRKNDQLFFEHQEAMAAAFDLTDRDGMLAVEHFMREVYGCLQTIAVTADLFFEYVGESLDRSAQDIAIRDLEPGIEKRGDFLHFVNREAVELKPALLMRIFSLGAKKSLPLHYRTKKIIHDLLHLVDEKFCRSRTIARRFFDLLQDKEELQPAIKTMHETGLLGVYLPEFHRVESLAQHDIYHIYTVDSHLLQTVVEISRLKDEEQSTFEVIQRPHILFLAGLLHDVGKGSGKNHSEFGAQLVAGIGARLGLETEACEDLVFLVRHHLLMTDTAMRRDLDDEAFIGKFGRRITTPDRLAMLYLLSIADARATGPAAWNEWKAALLLELYLKAARVLTKVEAGETSPEPGAVWHREKLKQLVGRDQVMTVNALPDDYLVNFSPETVTRHLEYRQQLITGAVKIVAENRRTFWSLLIMTTDRPGLLSRICGVLALHNLNILGAQIFTWGDGTVVDALDLSSAVGEDYSGQDWEELQCDLNLAINNRLGLPYRLNRKMRPKRRSRPNGNKRATARVEIDNETSDRFTVIEVYAGDQPGSLYNLTRTLADFDLNICMAKISKNAEQMVDVFYLHDGYGRKIEEQELQEEIRQSLLYAVNIQ